MTNLSINDMINNLKKLEKTKRKKIIIKQKPKLSYIHAGWTTTNNDLNKIDEFPQVIKELIKKYSLSEKYITAAIHIHQYRPVINSDDVLYWYNVNKNKSEFAIAVGYYLKLTKNTEFVILEVYIQGKPFYFNIINKSNLAPFTIKKHICLGLFGNRQDFPCKIHIPVKAYIHAKKNIYLILT